jgi:hypothetical protein
MTPGRIENKAFAEWLQQWQREIQSRPRLERTRPEKRTDSKRSPGNSSISKQKNIAAEQRR